MKREKYLTRTESIERLYDVINSGIIENDLCEDIEEIANLIEYELSGEHFWGQTYESGDKLRVSYREDLWTDELIQECKKQHENARFIPAPNEIQELKDYYMDLHFIDEDTDAKTKERFKKDFAEHYGVNITL